MLAFIADLLTLSRLLAAAILVWLGFQGPETLPKVVLVTALAWTTDQLDGWAARRAAGPTHLAQFDFTIDTVLYAATLAYLTLAQYIPPALSGIFLAAALALWLLYRRRAIAILCIRLIDLASIVIIFKHRPLIGACVVAWLAVLGVAYRQRIVERVPRWLAEFRELIGIKAT